MLNQTPDQYMDQTLELAWSRGEIASLAHLFVILLKTEPLLERFGSRASSAAEDIQGKILREQLRKSDAREKKRAAFQPDEFRSGVANADLFEPVERALLGWLLQGGISDSTLPYATKLCRNWQITSMSLSGEGKGMNHSGHEARVGEPATPEWRQLVVSETLIGRDDDLHEQRAHLGAAIKGGHHFWIEGAPGVGKSAFARRLIAGCATKWIEGSDPILKRVEFLYVSSNSFVGTRDQNKATLQVLFDQLVEQPSQVPVIDGYESFSGSSNLAKDFNETFGALLANRGRSVVLVRNSHGVGIDPQLSQSGSLFRLSPLARQSSVQVIKSAILDMARSSEGLRLEADATECASKIFRWAADYYPGRYQPEIGIHIVRGGFSRAFNINQEAISEDDFWRYVCEEQTIGSGEHDDEIAFFDHVERRLCSEFVLGQDHAVKSVLGFLKMRVRMAPRRSPRGIFLFAGPPGIGKTELGRGLATTLGYDPDEGFHVFNMSEYSGEGARTRFMGADPGYAGYGQTRTIYDVCRINKPCVILLDEIDRAHAQLQDILLSIFEGQGKDSNGYTVHFSNAIFILTTNRQQETIRADFIHDCRDLNEESQRYEYAADCWSGDRLQRLLSTGVSSAGEESMRAYLNEALEDAVRKFDMADANDRMGRLSEYLSISEKMDRFNYTGRHSVMDLAFLNRVDRFIPFFPIQGQALIQRLVKLMTVKEGWEDCPKCVRNNIVQSFSDKPGSVRDLKVMIGREMETHLANAVVSP